MTHSPDHAERAREVAAGLTKAGIIILRRMRPEHWHEAFYLRSSSDVWAPAATFAALARKGLVSINREMELTRYMLTDAGLAVRAALHDAKEAGEQGCGEGRGV